MKLLWAFLFSFQALAAETAPDCNGLSKILQNFELDLAKASVKNGKDGCDKFEKPEDVVLYGNSLEVFNNSKCESLNLIETKLKDLENKEAIFQGFQKMRLDLKLQKAQVNSPDLEKARKAAGNFISTLQIAQSFESLVSVESGKSLDFLTKLKSKVETSGIINQNGDLKKFVSEICGQLSSQDGACKTGNFNPSIVAAQDVVNVLKKLPSPIKKDDLQAIQEEIKIKHGKTGIRYSFTEMLKELQDKIKDAKDEKSELVKSALKKISATGRKSEALARAEILAIKSLPNIEGASTIISNEQFKKDLDSKVGQDKYKLVLDDIKKRQELEIRSKTSILVALHNKRLKEEDQTKCKDAVKTLAIANECIEALEKSLPESGVRTSDLNELANTLIALKASSDYHNHIDKVDFYKCTNANPVVAKSAQAKEAVSKDAASEFSSGKVDSALEMFGGKGCKVGLDVEKLEKLYSEIHGLRAVRDQILKENEKKIEFRNYAIMKMVSLKCDNKRYETSNLDLCEQDSMIDREAISLTNDVMNISLVFTAPKDGALPDITEECKAEKKSSEETKLCAFINGEKVSDALPPEKKKEEEEAYIPPTAPGKRNESGIGSYIANVAGFATEVLRGAAYTPYTPVVVPPPSYATISPGAPGVPSSSYLMNEATALGGLGCYRGNCGRFFP